MKNLLKQLDQYELENALEIMTESEILEIAEKLNIETVDKLEELVMLIGNEEVTFYKGFSEDTMIEYIEDENYGFYFSELPTVIKEHFDFEKFFEDECKGNILKISTGFIRMTNELTYL